MEGIVVLLTPLFSFLVILVFGRRIGDFASGVVASVSAGLTTLFSFIITLKALNQPIHFKLYNFLPIGDYTLSLGFYFDPLSSIMATVVT
ncbi:MAG: NADH-quinone oxidoreductase subunit L, partial [Aquificae bacterium]|nr:NADH-quinone oxidoreductase subunit L [Aquificota bacterium]